MKDVWDRKDADKCLNKHDYSQKPYHQPKLMILGRLVSDTLPGGSKNTEGGSGKGHGF